MEKNKTGGDGIQTWEDGLSSEVGASMWNPKEGLANAETFTRDKRFGLLVGKLTFVLENWKDWDEDEKGERVEKAGIAEAAIVAVVVATDLRNAISFSTLLFSAFLLLLGR